MADLTQHLGLLPGLQRLVRLGPLRGFADEHSGLSPQIFDSQQRLILKVEQRLVTQRREDILPGGYVAIGGPHLAQDIIQG